MFYRLSGKGLRAVGLSPFTSASPYGVADRPLWRAVRAIMPLRALTGIRLGGQVVW